MSELALLGGDPVRTEGWPSWPVIGAPEIEALTRVIESETLGSGKGEGEVTRFEREFAALQGAKHGAAVHCGTSAIRVALQSLGVKYGDEVIVPAYTFIASASPILDLGAVPIFVDIHPDTYNIDPAAVEAAITPRTTGIVPVHFGGLPADMDSILAIAAKHGLWVMEDAAQAWGAEWNGVGVGHIGNAGIFSFQSSKNITAGEGGIVLTDDDDMVELFESYRNCGRSSEGLSYGHYYLAGNYRMAETAGAMLRVQLERYPEQLELRGRNGIALAAGLAEIPGLKPLVRAPQVTRHPYHLFIWQFDSDSFGGLSRETFIDAMRKEGVNLYQGYSMPLHHQPVIKEKRFDPKHAAQSIDYASVSCPVAERACASEALWMSQFVLLADDKAIDDIVASARKVRQNVDDLLEYAANKDGKDSDR
jgi:dTDP-4-amino-4,6-dideoxygalactose transaminase